MQRYTLAEIEHIADGTKASIETVVRVGKRLQELEANQQAERRASSEEKFSITNYVEGAEHGELSRLTNMDILANAGIPVLRQKAQGPRRFATVEQKRVLQITHVQQAAE